MEEPETQHGDTTQQTGSRTPPGSKTRWVVGAVVLIIAAVIGIVLGANLGSRQGGPLSAQGAVGARPTIVLGSAAPSPAASPSVVAAASPSPVGTAAVAGSTTYVVQPGDTLRSIAQDQYGDATLWPRIYDANRDVIGPSPDALIAGTTLQIPPK